MEGRLSLSCAEIGDMPLVVAGDDKTKARHLQRLAERGHLRRIYVGIYTDDLGAAAGLDCPA